MSGRRTVRTRPRNGLAISDILTAAIVSELCSPSDEVWLVSGWATDIVVLDNKDHRYDAVMGPAARSHLTLSEAFAQFTRNGTEVHVALRENDHNFVFADKLRRACAHGLLGLYSSPDLHEKILVGSTWLLKGSMNFTWSGTHRNEESVEFEVNSQQAASQRLELRTRWIGGGS